MISHINEGAAIGYYPGWSVSAWLVAITALAVTAVLVVTAARLWAVAIEGGDAGPYVLALGIGAVGAAGWAFSLWGISRHTPTFLVVLLVVGVVAGAVAFGIRSAVARDIKRWRSAEILTVPKRAIATPITVSAVIAAVVVAVDALNRIAAHLSISVGTLLAAGSLLLIVAAVCAGKCFVKSSTYRSWLRGDQTR
jgi:hypothetical protein